MSHDAAHAKAQKSNPQHAPPDHDLEAEHDPERARRVSTSVLLRDAKHENDVTPERVEAQIEFVHGHVELVASRMTNHRAGISRDEINVLRKSLEQERSLLLKSAKQLPKGSPLIARATDVAERAHQIADRLADFANAKDAQTAVEKEYGSSDDGADHIRGAREKNDGFCDRAPQQVAPCVFDEAERNRRRDQVRAAVHQLARNWAQGINSKYLEEKFKQRSISFEQQLGQVLFNVLFGVIGAGAKALVAKGIDKMDRALSTGVKIEGDWAKIKGPDPDNVAFAKSTANKVIDQAPAIMQQTVTGTITSQQLAERAAKSVQIPTDRETFLQSLEDVPSQWETHINQNLLKDLFDDDLAFLSETLPQKASEMVPSRFKQEIEKQLKRFEEQVLAVDTAPLFETRPIYVITGHGPVRAALVRPEKKPDSSLHGEWRNSPTRTGKWTFVRWIDDDMREMAMTSAIQGKFGHADPTAAAQMHMATDATFWDAQSLKLLAGNAHASKADGVP